MSSNNVTLCPVRAAAAIVCQIKSYPGANHNTPISAIWRYNRIKHITSTQIRNALWDAIKAIGEDILHISVKEIGTHSIHSGAAMAMFLGRIGHWSSNAFLSTFAKRSKNSTTRFCKKCLPRCFTGTFQIIRHPQFHISTQGNTAIPTMPRQESM